MPFEELEGVMMRIVSIVGTEELSTVRIPYTRKGEMILEPPVKEPQRRATEFALDTDWFLYMYRPYQEDMGTHTTGRTIFRIEVAELNNTLTTPIEGRLLEIVRHCWRMRVWRIGDRKDLDYDLWLNMQAGRPLGDTRDLVVKSIRPRFG